MAILDPGSAAGLEQWFADGLARIDAVLEAILPAPNEPPGRIHQAMRHSVFAGGKRLRPMLVLAAAEACGPIDDAVLHAACAIELVHTFSLIHDDLPALDNDDLRRGLPTCHVAYGEDMAILAGDALHTLAFSVLASLPATPDAAKLSCIRLLADACGTRGMVGGQVDDLLSEGVEIPLEHLRSIHARKTGELLRASVLSGAVLTGADDPSIE
ncbi:MAG: polyprenyl synthetase family protein, partial [Armatimonadota bacterium]